MRCPYCKKELASDGANRYVCSHCHRYVIISVVPWKTETKLTECGYAPMTEYPQPSLKAQGDMK